MKAKLIWKDSDGRQECWSGEDTPTWAVYCPPPGQSSGPRKVQQIPPRGFVGTRPAMANVAGVFLCLEDAENARVKED